MSCNCSCGSDCKCGSGCKCGMYPDLSYSETTSTETIIAGVAPVKMFSEGSEMSYGAENDCKCGSNCSCHAAATNDRSKPRSKLKEESCDGLYK